MNQILHIFRKDVRHFWIEIASSLAILALYVWHTVHEWGGRHLEFGFSPFSDIWGFVMVLVPVSWCLLIVRSMQDESLVGDRQFWITRPYDWWKLAIEKLLLAVVFIHLPLLITHIFLLHYAGFPVAHSLPAILLVHLMVFLFLDLTTALVGSVTGNIVQVLVWIVGIVLYIAGMVTLFDYLPGGYMPTTSDSGDYAAAIAAGACMLALIVFQFVRRTTWLARFVIVGAVLLLTALLSSIPFLGNPASDFPALGAGEESPVTIQMLKPGPPKATAGPDGLHKGKEVAVSFSMMASQTEDGAMSMTRGSLVTIETPDGRRWNSHWQGHFYQYWPGETPSSVTANVERKFFEKYRDIPVKVRFSFAVTTYRETNVRRITAQEGIFPVPGAGQCWTQGDYELGSGADWVKCMAPLQHASLMGWFESAASTCRPEPGADSSLDPNLHETLYLFDTDDDSPPRIIPLDFYNLDFAPRVRGIRDKSPLGICGGTPFTLATPESYRNFRIETELDGVKLSEYLPNGGNRN